MGAAWHSAFFVCSSVKMSKIWPFGHNINYAEGIFNEEQELTFFSEDRKVVKQKLEDLGYEVSYARKRMNPDVMLWNTYYNEYTVKW